MNRLSWASIYSFIQLMSLICTVTLSLTNYIRRSSIHPMRYLSYDLSMFRSSGSTTKPSPFLQGIHSFTLKKTNFSHLYPRSHSFGIVPKYMKIGTSICKSRALAATELLQLLYSSTWSSNTPRFLHSRTRSKDTLIFPPWFGVLHLFFWLKTVVFDLELPIFIPAATGSVSNSPRAHWRT